MRFEVKEFALKYSPFYVYSCYVERFRVLVRSSGLLLLQCLSCDKSGTKARRILGLVFKGGN